MKNQVQITINGVPVEKCQPMGMVCEYNNCNRTDGKDYTRPSEMKENDGWDNEPVFLCELHASEMKAVPIV